MFSLDKPNRLNKEIVLKIEKHKPVVKPTKAAQDSEEFDITAQQENSVYSNNPHTAQSLRQTTSKSTN